MTIRQATHKDLPAIRSIMRSAFGSDDEAELTANLLSDDSALPVLSLLAIQDRTPVGHILFTNATITGTHRQTRCSLLAPLAVVPDHQNKGIGKSLIHHGIEQLRQTGVELVFVLGHPGYYTRHGFAPAGKQGINAPYPIPDKHADAWMVRPLTNNVIGSVTGTLKCANALARPEYWRE